MIVMAALLLWLNDRILDRRWHRQNPPEKLAALQKRLEERILKPDWEFYETHLQRPAPQALRELFANTEYLLNVNLEFGDVYISSFRPLDRESLNEMMEWSRLDVIPFAECDGDSIFLQPGENEPDTVYMYYHDGGEVGVLAPDITTFVHGLKPFDWDEYK